MISGSIRATRVIGCEFAARKVRALIIPYAIGAVLMIALTAWLLHFSRWWVLAALPIYTAVILGALVLVTATISIRTLRGTVTPDQRSGVNTFVDKIERVADGMQVGPFFILMRVVRDIIWPKQSSFISQMSRDSTTLHTDFLDLQQKFN